jgi:hypothetical protein
MRMEKRLSSRRPKTRGHVVIRTIMLKADGEDVASVNSVWSVSRSSRTYVVIGWSETRVGDTGGGLLARADRIDPWGMSVDMSGGGGSGGCGDRRRLKGVEGHV